MTPARWRRTGRENFGHDDVVAAEDDAENPVVRTIGDFVARNVQ